MIDVKIISYSSQLPIGLPNIVWLKLPGGTTVCMIVRIVKTIVIVSVLHFIISTCFPSTRPYSAIIAVTLHAIWLSCCDFWERYKTVGETVNSTVVAGGNSTAADILVSESLSGLGLGSPPWVRDSSLAQWLSPTKVKRL